MSDTRQGSNTNNVEHMDTHDEVLAYLSNDRGDAPCSRYGRRAAHWQPWAAAVAVIVSRETGEPITEEAASHAASQVVNDSDEPLDLVRKYGRPYGYTVDPDSDEDSPELIYTEDNPEPFYPATT